MNITLVVMGEVEKIYSGSKSIFHRFATRDKRENRLYRSIAYYHWFVRALFYKNNKLEIIKEN